MTYRQQLIEQVRRDIETLTMGETFTDPPGRAFYEARIAAYRQAVRDLDAAEPPP